MAKYNETEGKFLQKAKRGVMKFFSKMKRIPLNEQRKKTPYFLYENFKVIITLQADKLRLKQTEVALYVSDDKISHP